MFRRILPEYVAVREGRIENLTGHICPVETHSLGRATESRVREFRAGRACAHEAVLQLGVPDKPLVIGPNREPIWPKNVAGSITHKSGYCAAAATLRHRGLGIDLEIASPIPPDALAMAATAADRVMLDSLPADRTPWCAVLFSAKESVFKAWFLVAQTWLDFDDVNLSIDPVELKFDAQLKGKHRELARSLGFSDTWGGSFLVDAGRVFTCCLPTARETK